MLPLKNLMLMSFCFSQINFLLHKSTWKSGIESATIKVEGKEEKNMNSHKKRVKKKEF